MSYITEDTPISEAFYYGWEVMRLLADVSNFNDEEIRCLAAKNPPLIKSPEKWDGILIEKEPIQGDLGINKKRETFCFYNGKWKSTNVK